jgi:hypothetical protein
MDLGEALAWFERALEQGDDRAKEMVEQLGGAVSPKHKFRFVDKTAPGKNFGIVGIGGVARPEDSRDSDEEEYFRIYAESGMTAADFAGETARKYAEYLESEKKKG